MKSIRWTWVLAMAVAGLTAGAWAQETTGGAKEVRVTASGKAQILKGDKESAKKAALQDAERNAVEQVGAEVMSETVVENFELVKDKVVTQAHGFVKDLKVLEEGADGDVYRAKIECSVATDPLKDMATRVYQEMSKPRMMVLLQEAQMDKVAVSNIAENALLSFLSDKGFALVDMATAKEKIKRDELRQAAEGDAKAAAKLGLRTGAEVVLVGTASVGNPESVQGILYAAKSTVALRAIKTDNAAIYAAVNATDSGIDGVSDAAPKKAIEKATKKAGDQIFWKILKAWNDERMNGVDLELVVTNLNYSGVKKLKEGLEKTEGVTGVNQRSFDAPTGTFNVTFRGNADRLADVLTSGTVGGLKLDVVSVTPGQLTMKVK